MSPNWSPPIQASQAAVRLATSLGRRNGAKTRKVSPRRTTAMAGERRSPRKCLMRPGGKAQSSDASKRNHMGGTDEHRAGFRQCRVVTRDAFAAGEIRITLNRMQYKGLI